MLLAGHGAPRHRAAQESILAQAAALARAAGCRVHAGFLTADPSIAEAASALGDDPLVVLPMFMADGYLVRSAVPRALGRDARILTPLGLLPGLGDLIASQAADACISAGLLPQRVTVLIAGHGSAHGDASRRAVTAQAQRVASTARFGGVEMAFLEEHPRLDEQLRRCRGDLIVSGFFAAPGAHAGEDVPQLLAADRCNETRKLIDLGPIGAHAGVVPLLAEALGGAI